MITLEEKQQLQAKGYVVEDMQEAWGSGWWSGQYRWLNNQLEVDGFGTPQTSEEAAWEDALQYDRQLTALA